MTNEQLRLQMLSGIITESEYKAKLEESKSTEPKDSLNENFVGMGMIGSIFDREKTDYEMAFEHFLGERYETKFENREQDLEEVKEAMVNPNTDDRVSYLENTLDMVWKRGKDNNLIDFKDLAQSIVNDMFDDLEEGKKANLNESALAIAGGIVLGALGLKAIMRIMRGISSAVSLARMTDPKELKRSVEEIGKEAMQKGRNPLQIALWMMTVNSLIEKGEIKNGLSLAKTWGNIDKIDLEKVFSSSESGGVEEGKKPNNY